MKEVLRHLSLLLFILECYASPNITESTKFKEEHYEGKGSIYAEDLADSVKFLHQFDRKADSLMEKNALTNWAYETDLTDKNLQNTIDIGLDLSDFFLNASEAASQIKTLDLPTRIQRQISWIRRSADPTSDEMRREIKETIGKMTSIFGKGKVTKKTTTYTLAELTDILRTSRKRSELDWAWKAWRDEVGPPIRLLYGNLVDLLNIGAREHGWIDYGNYLRSDYEMGDDFELSLDKVWTDIAPLYQELHAYVRYKLAKVFKFKKTACIPANLLGDMFAQNWENIFNLVKPWKDSRTFDVTKELKKQKYTVEKMFKSAESFFVSIGLFKMPPNFWKKSVFVKRKSKEMVCHASAWDISATDVRIKMCTNVRQSDLTTVHHEMGHIEYYLSYKELPSTFRAGANPGFHEAIGDTISLSVETPSYLDDIGLLKKKKLNDDDAISFLLNQALRRVAPIPYNLLVDKWRWRVYEGNITDNTYNTDWWKLRVLYQGVEPPVKRPYNAFDPASKYHIAANSPYISYFVSYVLQFQLHKAFCQEAGFNGPLHSCSIYKSQAAGKKLRKMLESGRSEPWPKILKEATGDRELKAKAILEYFEPLSKWLKEQRAEKAYPLGWKDEMCTHVMQKQIKSYESGQGRSGILKTDSGEVQLSINIPNNALNELLGKSEVSKENSLKPLRDSKTISPNDKVSQNDKDGSKSIDLVALLTSGSPVSIKSIETNTMADNGNKGKSVKEIAINTTGTKPGNYQIPNAELNSADKEKETFIQSLVSALRVGILNTTQYTEDTHKETPVAAMGHHLATQPPQATITHSVKENPRTAGISPESQNPTTAGLPQALKSNYVPSSQIALLPISIPNTLLSQFQNTLKTNTTVNNMTINLASFLTNATTVPTGESKNLLKSETQNSTTVNNTIGATGNEKALNDLQLIDNFERKVNSTALSSDLIPNGEKKLSSFTSKQTITPCKRSGSCYNSKVVTESDAFPLSNSNETNQSTISISPSLLIQKLIEHNEAEKSTPDPVVNLIPGTSDLKQNKVVEEKETLAKAIDVNQLIKALTNVAGSKTANQSIISTKTDKNVLYTSNIKNEEKGKASAQEPFNTIEHANTTNCTEKRKISLNFHCPDYHKGGTLSISSAELLQRLLGPKENINVDKKTLPSTQVVKTENGFQLNFPLNTKDKIPADFSVKMTNPRGRQQHVDVLNTPKGMVVKPLKSLQLLTPLFVPVQNKDIVELRKDG